MRKSGALPELKAARGGVSRREFLQSAALVAGAGLAINDLFVPEALLGVSVAAAAYFTGDRIASTPAFNYRAYRSKGSEAADAVSWVQVDLGEPQMIDAVKLYPANQTMVPGKDEYYAGEGFPVRFKIEASTRADFSRPLMIVDRTHADFENPRDNILRFPAEKLKARYVRLTVTKFPQPLCMTPDAGAPEAVPGCATQGAYWFALSKMAVVSGGKDIAVGRTVSADPIHGNEKDLAQLTRAGTH